MANTNRGLLDGLLKRYADSIASIESAGSGGYSAIGPKHPKYGRALGRYQVMEANLPQWGQEALGHQVTPEQFLSTPALQDQIFQHRFGGYVNKYGNPQDAASAWFTGRPLAQGANAKDVLGTSGQGYVDKFNAALGQPQQMQAGLLSQNLGNHPQKQGYDNPPTTPMELTPIPNMQNPEGWPVPNGLLEKQPEKGLFSNPQMMGLLAQMMQQQPLPQMKFLGKTRNPLLA